MTDEATARQQAATGPAVLRRINAVAVLDALRVGGPQAARVADLAAATGLSRPAVTRALAALTESGLVVSTDADQSAGAAGTAGKLGRPAQHVRFRAEFGHVVGVDVGPHKVLAVLADLAGRTLATCQLAVPAQVDGPRLFETVRTALTAVAGRAATAPERLLAVSVGTPGVVPPGSDTVRVAPSIPGWAGLPVVPRLRDWLNCPVTIDNDVDLAVLGEQWRGGSAAARSLVFVQWGERIGTGLVLDGRPHRGATGAAGELGFVDLLAEPDTVPDRPLTERLPDGLGPFEHLAGAAAIRRLARAAGAPLGPDGDTAPLFAAAAAGDAVALAVVDQVAARFARGLAVLLLLLDPDKVVIGGGLSRAGRTLLDPVRAHLRRHTLADTEITASALGDGAVAVGAVRRALDLVEPQLTAALG
ncbi:ROK family protein [Streptomyces tateyamensis]|uniref:ROK family protein n=1 Tax=Streptomyces tateyamensis TaxID=565073 RepID=UPI0015E8A89D|nr:ROK family protein [Streptomyces tateyamensis]